MAVAVRVSRFVIAGFADVGLAGSQSIAEQGLRLWFGDVGDLVCGLNLSLKVPHIQAQA